MTLQAPDTDEYRKHAEYLARVVSVREHHIVIDVSSECNIPEYNIPLSRCSTYAEILGWAHHLTEKTWVSTEVLRRFIAVACDANKLDVPHV